MIGHEQPPNWVAERAKCRVDLIFEALRQVIERDVAEFNKLSANDRTDRTAILIKNGDGIFPMVGVQVRSAEGSKQDITFVQEANILKVHAANQVLNIGAAWDPKRQACLLTDRKGDKTYESPWELSQAVLGPFLF